MKRVVSLLLMVLFIAGTALTQVQQNQVSLDDAKRISNYPELKLSAEHQLKSLPTIVDNTATKYFPEVFNQYGYSCNQASSIGYVFTYELNETRDVPATQIENLYPPLSVWNLLNDATYGQGVSFFDSWEVIKANGVPNYTDYGYDNYFEKKWMTGYDKYYRGMHNKPMEVYTIKTHNENGIKTLKHWLNDHADGSPNGGIASFQIGSSDARAEFNMRMESIPEGEEAAGKFLMTRYAPGVGHAMTVVGYNDFVRWDYNQDGEYTNDVDLNEDGIIDVRDWENGAFLVVNSWGTAWGDKGRVYVPYRLFAMEPVDGGIWEQCVTVVKPFEDYTPQLTFKVGINYTKRAQLKVVAGVSTNIGDIRPEHVLEFPFFNYLGDFIPMQGLEAAGAEVLEFGLDVSPLLKFVEKGQTAKFFLEVYQRQGGTPAGHGEISSFSVIDYGSGQAVETISQEKDKSISIDAVTRLFALVATQASAPKIVEDELPQAQVGAGFINKLSAVDGQAPYSWSQADGEYVAYENAKSFAWPTETQQILGVSDTSRLLVDLGFSFEFYGETYSQVVVLKNGGILMGSEPRDYPYVIDKELYTMQNAGIFPFYTGDLEYSFMGDGVYRKDVGDGVIFAWDATLSKYTGTYDPKFYVKIHKNGNFEYGLNTLALTAEWEWVSIVSAGDQIQYTKPEINSAGLFRGNVHFDFRQFEWPEWLFFTPTGSLLGTPPATATSMWLPITVSDKYGVSSTKALFLDIQGGMGIGDVIEDSGIKVYPNPVTDRLFIEAENIDKIIVLNSVGQVVMEQDTYGKALIKLDVASLQEGIYFVKVGAEIRKIVKK